MLVKNTVGESVDANGVVRFKDITQFGIANKCDLYVPTYVKLPYPFLASNINTIVDHLSNDTAEFEMSKCIERLFLLTGYFSRTLCGLKNVVPSNAKAAFTVARLTLLKDPYVPFRAVFDENTVSITDVIKVVFIISLFCYE